MDGIWLIVLIVAVVSGAASAHIAGAKGLDKSGYFVLGFFFPLIGILVAGFMPPSEDNKAGHTDHRKAGHTDDRLVAAAPPASSDDEWITSLRNLKDDGDSGVLETYRKPLFDRTSLHQTQCDSPTRQANTKHDTEPIWAGLAEAAGASFRRMEIQQPGSLIACRRVAKRESCSFCVVI